MPVITDQEFPRAVTYEVGETPSAGPFDIPFPFYDDQTVTVYVGATEETGFTITKTSPYGTTGNYVTLDTPVSVVKVTIVSDTSRARSLAETFVLAQLSTEIDRIFALFQEGDWLISRALVEQIGGGGFDADGNPIVNVGDPTDPNDVVNLAYFQQQLDALRLSIQAVSLTVSNVFAGLFDGGAQTVKGETPSWNFYAPNNAVNEQLWRIRLTTAGYLLVSHVVGPVIEDSEGRPVPDTDNGAEWSRDIRLTKALATERIGFQSAAPAANEAVLFAAVPECNVPADFAGSYGFAGTPPSADIVFSIERNGTEVGTATVDTAGDVTFSTTDPTGFNFSGANRKMKVVAPADLLGAENISMYFEVSITELT